jgi:hypothetical protein
MTTRAIKKSLIAKQDLLLGKGTAVQTRNGLQYPVDKLDLVMGADSIADLSGLVGDYDGQKVSVKGYHAGSDVGGGIFYWDSSRTGENDGGTVFNGWVRLFEGGFIATWFGAVGDGISNDTIAIQSALSKANTEDVGSVILPSGLYAVDGLSLPVGVYLIGDGGHTTQYGKNSSSSVIKIRAGGSGLVTYDNSGRRGGGLVNIGIDGINSQSAIGLAIRSTSFQLRQVSIYNFKSGVGLSIGFSWRTSFTDVEVWYCGIGMLWDGSVGSVNGCSFVGLVIEECCVGFYQTPSATGSIANTLASPVIESCGRNRGTGVSWPSYIAVNSNITSLLGLTSDTIEGAIYLNGGCIITAPGLYLEDIDGCFIYVSTNSILSASGFFIDEYNSNTTVGAIIYAPDGSVDFQSGQIIYDSTKTVPVFDININNKNIVLNNRYVIRGGGGRLLFKDSQTGVGGPVTELNNRYRRSLLADSDGRILGMSPINMSLAWVDVTPAANITLDCSKGSLFYVADLNQNATVTAINPTDGQIIEVFVDQDTVGGRAVTWGSAFLSVPWTNTGNTSNTKSMMRFRYKANLGAGLWVPALATNTWK